MADKSCWRTCALYCIKKRKKYPRSKNMNKKEKEKKRKNHLEQNNAKMKIETLSNIVVNILNASAAL